MDVLEHGLSEDQTELLSVYERLNVRGREFLIRYAKEIQSIYPRPEAEIIFLPVRRRLASEEPPLQPPVLTLAQLHRSCDKG